MVVKGNGLIYEMGNTIQTELDIVLDEASSKIKEIKISASMDGIIAHAQSQIDMTLNIAPERIEQLAKRINSLEENNHDTPSEPAQRDAPNLTARIQSGITAANIDIANQLQILKHGISTLNHTVDNSILTSTQDATAKIDTTLDTIKALLVVQDNEITEMRKTCDAHIETLATKLHDAYTQPVGTTPAEGPYLGQYENYDQPPDAYQPRTTPSTPHTRHEH
jgi:hypothetical protein